MTPHEILNPKKAQRRRAETRGAGLPRDEERFSARPIAGGTSRRAIPRESGHAQAVNAVERRRDRGERPASIPPQPAADPRVCRGCGRVGQRPLKYGYCQQTPACKREYDRAWRAANRERVREQKREQKRAWYAANPEKARERARAWYAANREKARELARAWRAANPEKVREQKRAWRAANPEKARERARERARAWYAANPEKARELARAWRAANPEKVAEAKKRRRILQGCLPGTMLRGERHPYFRGGTYCYCCICHAPLGWRSPTKIPASGPRCWKHKAPKKWRPADARPANQAV